MFVRNCMTPNPITIKPDTPIFEALNIMKKNNIRQLPVVDKAGKLLGIVTEREILTVSPSPASTLSIYEMNYLLSKMQVKDIMNRQLVTVSPELNIEDAALIMRDKKIGSLLVIQEDALVGIITQTDIFDAMLKAFGIRKAGTRIVIETEDRVGALAELLQIVKEHRINVIGVASLEKSDRIVQIMLRLSTADASELVNDIKQKGFQVIAVS
ncbi:CBS and ACT domain-containing protein [Desulfurispora thermophila]|uniref:CBS and ACT domain-containing protein n=1 Tax=Desulfurispora thermophila TaxID=265470 RepID=UPI00037433F2|nr:CBS and ACT domain-containing protein [Desulfurispora thermophila]